MRAPVLVVLAASIAISVQAQQEPSPEELAAAETRTRLQHKIRMVELILNGPGMQQRLQDTVDQMASDLVVRAANNFSATVDYFDRGEYLEAEAILDFVLRDLSAASQLLSAESRIRDSYDQSLRQLDAFEFPEWLELTPAQSAVLQARLEEIAGLRTRAVQVAEGGDHETALGLVDRAYRLKSALLAELPHRQVVVYDLAFDTPREEYDYLTRRVDHYFELIEIALSRAVIGIQARKLVDDYIYRAVAAFDEAQGLGQRQRLAEANLRLDEAIERLVSALKILGVNI